MPQHHLRGLVGAALALALAILPAAAGTGSAGAVTTPSFTNYSPPAPLGRDVGEPSIGADWATGNAMFQAGDETLRVAGLAGGSPTWTRVGATLTSIATLDPILFTDSGTDRTFASQLAGACSLMAFSDDDGASWTQNPFGCGIGAAADHQTVGGGPFAPGLSGVGYSRAVYYCAQAIVSAECALSIDGGLTFDPAVPIYTVAQCNGLRGHIKVGPDGTAYVPNADCGGRAAVVVTANNGVTWSVRPVPGSTTQDESDPSLAIGSGNTVYYGWQNGTSNAAGSQPYVGVSHDHGQTWTNVQDVGAALGIKNVQFPAMVAGDDSRAAFAFLGSTTGGDDQASVSRVHGTCTSHPRTTAAPRGRPSTRRRATRCSAAASG